jgi:Tfp pilus assembly protein PilN
MREIGAWSWAFLTWTLGGLPGWVILPGFLSRWSQPLHVNRMPIQAGDLPKGAVLDVLLGSDLLLEKRLALPVAARANLSKAIDLNMRQSLPGGGADLLWCHGAGQRQGANLNIPIYLLKKSVLAEIRSAASSDGAMVRSINVAGDRSALPFWDNRKHMDRPRRFWWGIATFLLIAHGGLLLWQEMVESRSLQSRIALLEGKKVALSSQAVELRAKLDAQNTDFVSISRDMEVFKAEYHRLPILLSLTESLSDETWISEFAVNGNDLRLSGFTKQDVTEVMASIRGLAWVQRVDLDGPVSFDSFSRQNRFDLSVSLRLGSGEQP